MLSVQGFALGAQGFVLGALFIRYKHVGIGNAWTPRRVFLCCSGIGFSVTMWSKVAMRVNIVKSTLMGQSYLKHLVLAIGEVILMKLS